MDKSNEWIGDVGKTFFYSNICDTYGDWSGIFSGRVNYWVLPDVQMMDNLSANSSSSASEVEIAP